MLTEKDLKQIAQRGIRYAHFVSHAVIIYDEVARSPFDDESVNKADHPFLPWYFSYKIIPYGYLLVKDFESE